MCGASPPVVVWSVEWEDSCYWFHFATQKASNQIAPSIAVIFSAHKWRHFRFNNSKTHNISAKLIWWPSDLRYITRRSRFISSFRMEQHGNNILVWLISYFNSLRPLFKVVGNRKDSTVYTIITWGVLSVMVIIVTNGYSDLSSNPGRSCLYFS